jgi:hypothetical protein
MKTLWSMLEGVNVGIPPFVIRVKKPDLSTFAKVSPKINKEYANEVLINGMVLDLGWTVFWISRWG